VLAASGADSDEVGGDEDAAVPPAHAGADAVRDGEDDADDSDSAPPLSSGRPDKPPPDRDVHAPISDGDNVFEDVCAEDGVVQPYCPMQQAVQMQAGGTIAARTSQELSYANRGEPFWGYNLLEHACISDSIKSNGNAPDAAAASTTASRDTKRKVGRPANFTCPFDSGHPDVSTHHEQLRSLLRCPQLTGSAAPSFLGLPNPAKDQSVNLCTERARAAVAVYFLTLLVPWDPVTKAPPMELTWDNFVAWVRGEYDAHVDGDLLRNSFIGRCRRDYAWNCIFGYKTTRNCQEAQRNWRNRAADDRNSAAAASGAGVGGSRGASGGRSPVDAEVKRSEYTSAYKEMCDILLQRVGDEFGETGIGPVELAHDHDISAYLKLAEAPSASSGLVPTLNYLAAVRNRGTHNL
jgi:hypothetical protein